MRIIGKTIAGLDGIVQLVTTEDGELGSKHLYEEMSLREYRKTVQLLTAVLLAFGVEQLRSKDEYLKYWDLALSSNYPRGSAWPRSYEQYEDSVRPFIASAHPSARGVSAYLDLLGENVDAFIVRELARLLHMGAYRWVVWGVSGAYPDLNLLLGQTSFVRVLRGLQPFFKTAARRGDAYETTAPMQLTASKYLTKALLAKADYIEDQGFGPELEHLHRWCEYLRKVGPNRLETVAIYES